jgi:ArsR family transcriptional regulator
MAVPRITKEDLSAKINDAATTPVLVDVRLKYPYEHSTVKLPGAVRVAPPEFDLSSVPRDREVVAYDSDPYELVSARIAAQLIREGCQASALKGGIEEWLVAKLPTEAKEAPKQKPPVAGALKG